MNQNTNDNNSEKNHGCACCAVGCGVPSLFVLVLLILFIYSVTHEEFGENMPTAPMYNAEKGNNFCYDWTYLNRYFEFTISEQDFLDWCKNCGWEPIEIESLPSLPSPKWPDLSDGSAWPMINQKLGDKIPLSIVRYCYRKAEHKEW